MSKVRFGVLGAAKIAMEKVIPAMQQGELCHVSAVASRSSESAARAAASLGLEKSYGSYEELLADPEIDAVYIPLPNNLHVPWCIKALEAGKHVLCEKPIALDSEEAEKLLNVAKQLPSLKIMEAFMYRFHPQWIKAKELVADGVAGEVRAIQTFFSYYNDDGGNIRNKPEMGGGGLMDIGCYALSLSRFLFDGEPERVVGLADVDPLFGTDRGFSGLMDFGRGRHSVFTCSTQLADYQRVNIVGTTGRVEILIPFNAPPDEPCLLLEQKNGRVREHSFAICDQYGLQGDAFARAVLEDTNVPTPLEDAVNNMRAIDRMLKSARGGAWA